MKKLLTILMLLVTSTAFGQGFTYSYVDPCSKKLKTLYLENNQSVTVNYLGVIGTFTQADFQNGTFSSWVQGVQSQVTSQPCDELKTQAQVTQNLIITQNIISTLTSITAASTMNIASGNMMSNALGNSTSNSSDNSGSSPKIRKNSDKNGNQESSSGNQTNSSAGTTSGQGSGTGGTNPSTQNQNQGAGGQNPTQGGVSSNPNSTPQTGGQQAQPPVNNSGNGAPSTPSNGSSTPSSNSSGSTSGSSGQNTGGNSSGSENSGTSQNGGGNSQGSTNNSGGSSSSNSSQGQSQGQNVPEGSTPPKTQTDQGQSGNGGTTNSVSNAAESSSSNSGGSGGSKVRVGSLIGTGDIVAIRSAEDRSNQFKGTMSMTKANTNNTRAKGFLLNFTTTINNSNLTFYGAFSNKTKTNTLIIANSSMLDFDRNFFNTTTALESKRFGKLSLMGGLNFTAGFLADESFSNLSGVGGGFYPFKASKNLSGTVLLLGVYSPYTKFYEGKWWDSGILLVPFSSWDYAISKNFKYNVSFSGTYQVKGSVLNYQILTGGKILL